MCHHGKHVGAIVYTLLHYVGNIFHIFHSQNDNSDQSSSTLR